MRFQVLTGRSPQLPSGHGLYLKCSWACVLCWDPRHNDGGEREENVKREEDGIGKETFPAGIAPGWLQLSWGSGQCPGFSALFPVEGAWANPGRYPPSPMASNAIRSGVIPSVHTIVAI